MATVVLETLVDGLMRPKQVTSNGIVGGKCGSKYCEPCRKLTGGTFDPPKPKLRTKAASENKKRGPSRASAHTKQRD